MCSSRSWRRFLACVVSLTWAAAPAATVRFDLFPSDALTVEDPAQLTGRRIHLPLPEADAPPELRLLNELDGFSPNARLRIRFSEPIDPGTLKDGIRIVSGGTVIGVNQVVWDPASNTAFAKPDRILESNRRYTLVVTDAVRDTAGQPVLPSWEFYHCAGRAVGDCALLAVAVQSAAPAVAPARIVGAAVFTTMSATAWLDSARWSIRSVPTDFRRREGKSVFPFSELSSMTLRMQVASSPDRFTDFPLPFSLIAEADRIAFGSYRSPSFLDERQRIAAARTGVNEIAFHALLPRRAKPAAGYPVVITGHGFGDHRFAGPSALAVSFVAHGLAVVAINGVGHGYGPATRLVLREKSGAVAEADGGGRAVDLNGDGRFDSPEGCLILTSEAPLGLRDCLRQTVVDLMQLVRVLRAGVDLDGDGSVDLDPERTYYAGISLGAIYGTMLNAVEPDIRAAVLNVGGGSVAEIVRRGKTYHSYGVELLRARGMLNRGDDFDDAWPLRDQPARVVNEASALEIQELFERLEWLHAQGDPLFFASRLRKPVLWMFAKGDRSVPNPATSALVRAAGMRESAWLYRHDLARQALPSLEENPHAYLANLFSLSGLTIALAAQQQAAVFLATGEIIDPNRLVRPALGVDIFEIPKVLPEELNF